MPRYSVATEAQRDLDDIWVFIAQKDVDAARRMLAAIRERFPPLGRFPELGRSADFAPDLRRFAAPPYVIFCRPVEGGVEIVRVLHGARNLDEVFVADDN